MRVNTGLTCLAAVLAALSTSPAWGQPASFMEPIAGKAASTPASTATQNVLALNSAMFDLYGAAGRVFQQNIRANHPLILGMFSGAGGRFILYRPGQPALEAPSVPVSLPADEIGGSQHDGAGGGGDALSRQSRRPGLAGLPARIPVAHAVRARHVGPGGNAGWLARDHARDPGRQHRLHGPVRGAEGDHHGRAAGLREQAGAGAEEGHRLGRGDAGRALDGRAGRLEGDAGGGLGQGLCRKQHHLRCPAEQRSVQRARPVLPARGDQ